jgi:hypothetical protein
LLPPKESRIKTTFATEEDAFKRAATKQEQLNQQVNHSPLRL